jgi:hypothetical protein
MKRAGPKLERLEIYDTTTIAVTVEEKTLRTVEEVADSSEKLPECWIQKEVLVPFITSHWYPSANPLQSDLHPPFCLSSHVSTDVTIPSPQMYSHTLPFNLNPSIHTHTEGEVVILQLKYSLTP